MMSGTSLLIGLVAGSVGIGYFMYGKKQAKFYFMLSGICLIGYTYFLTNVILLILIGLGFAVLPFFLKE